MFRIKKLDIYIAKKFGVLFLGAFFICQFVLMMQFLWQYVDELIGKGLSIEVLGQFFWYMGMFLVPRALPLAILLSSLITFGNLSENSELTAIKASGVSLLQSFRSLAFLSVLAAFGSFYFQNNIGPDAYMKTQQLMLSMQQKSPELEIPEGIFYDGIPNTNLYVQKKNIETGKLYGIMIYRMTGSYEDQAIILADSGMLQSTAEKKHLLLHLWSGEWFENMESQVVAGSAAVPYRRETFAAKRIVLDFDGDFSLTDAGGLSTNARAKSLEQLRLGIDSLTHTYDSIGHAYYADAKRSLYMLPKISKNDSLKAVKAAMAQSFNIDSIYQKLSPDKRLSAVNSALGKVQSTVSDLDFKSLITNDGDRYVREHKIEFVNKFTLALSCLFFFFIGAPLGAIIRKGGLGVPVIISVLVFIVYFILDNTGYRMARGGMWTIAFGKGIAPGIMIPLAVFVSYKANNDSVVFNLDLYKNFFMKLLGLRIKRRVFGKEVIIENPNYAVDAQQLAIISSDIKRYSDLHHLRRMPNPVKVFFKYRADHEIERISEEMEQIIDDLTNTRDKFIITELNHYPVLSVKAHTRPFERRWMNMVAGIVVPLGIILYLRMWGFRLRLLRDLKTIKETNDHITNRIKEMGYEPQPDSKSII